MQTMGFHVPALTAKVLALGLVCLCMYTNTLFSSYASEEELETVSTAVSNSERCVVPSNVGCGLASCLPNKC